MPIAEVQRIQTPRVSSSPDLVGVMHLTDSLAAGGAERVAVNFANVLPRERYRAFLCTTRKEGPLSGLIARDVNQLHLYRKHRFDLRAVNQLVQFIRKEQIAILHAHSSSLLVAIMASLFAPYPRVIWHDHFGRFGVEKRPEWIFRLLTSRVSGVVAVSEPLAEWSRTRLRVRTDRVWYLPNFACETIDPPVPKNLPGRAGRRIICVANLRPEKDHLTLIRAMERVCVTLPDAHLLLVGAIDNRDHVQRVNDAIQQANLVNHITLLGPRRDVAGLLHACDIGVLSSASEGLPLSLLEYGFAALPVVATAVGQCADVLDHGRYGVVVPSRSPKELADAIISLLQSDQRRSELGKEFHNRVRDHYSAESATRQLELIYSTVLSADSPNQPGGIGR